MKRDTSRQFWRDHVQGWLQSGLIPAHYCLQHGLNQKRFSHWKVKMHGPSPHAGKTQTKPVSSQPPSPLIAIPIVEDNQSPDNIAKMDSDINRSGIIIRIAKNRRIELDIGFDEDETVIIC